MQPVLTPQRMAWPSTSSMRDEGLSGYHGRHVQRDGALGGFLDRVKAGQVVKGSVLIVGCEMGCHRSTKCRPA